MTIVAEAPDGGIVAELGGQSRPLVLRNGEIERFEKQYDTGIFQLFDQLLGRGNAPQVRHCRDLVALGLVGGGLTDRAADEIVQDLGPSANVMVRAIAQDLVMAAFVDPELLKKKVSPDGSSDETDPTDTTQPENSEMLPAFKSGRTSGDA